MSEQQETVTAAIDWADIGRKFRAPFDPQEVDFRVQGKPNAQGRAQVVTYIDARTVQDRLDDVVGPGAWSFEWEPVVVANGDVQAAKGTLTVHGVRKSDIGTASTFEASKGAVSDAVKRAAVHFGIGRYLYEMPSHWMPVEQGGRIPDNVLAQLRSRLPLPDGTRPAPTPTPTPTQPPQTERQERQERQAPAPTPVQATRPQTPQGAMLAAFEHAKKLGIKGADWAQLRTACGDDPVKIEQQLAARELVARHTSAAAS